MDIMDCIWILLDARGLTGLIVWICVVCETCLVISTVQCLWIKRYRAVSSNSPRRVASEISETSVTADASKTGEEKLPTQKSDPPKTPTTPVAESKLSNKSMERTQDETRQPTKSFEGTTSGAGSATHKPTVSVETRTETDQTKQIASLKETDLLSDQDGQLAKELGNTLNDVPSVDSKESRKTRESAKSRSHASSKAKATTKSKEQPRKTKETQETEDKEIVKEKRGDKRVQNEKQNKSPKEQKNSKVKKEKEMVKGVQTTQEKTETKETQIAGDVDTK